MITVAVPMSAPTPELHRHVKDQDLKLPCQRYPEDHFEDILRSGQEAGTQGRGECPRFSVNKSGTVFDGAASNLSKTISRLGERHQDVIKNTAKRKRPGTIFESTIPGIQPGKSGFTDDIHPDLQAVY